jgi:CIC family chloride channel protein
MAFGGLASHVFGPAAGQPALYAVVAMGAVFTSAARAPLTSVASVVEMTGDFTLTLPVMLAVAIATATSRALSYGTIYTTKLLRRGQDIDRTAPWRAFGDLKAADAMRPFPVPMAVPEGHGNGSDLDPVAQAPLPGRLIYEGDPQAVYAGESLAQTLRQLQEYGRDGLPVLSGDGRQVQGWITNQSVLQTVAHRIASSAPQQDAANDTTPGLKQPDAGPPTPLHGHRVLEVSIGPESPAVGRPLRSLSWPAGSVPVAILRQRSLREPDPELTLADGDRVSLLAPVPGGSAPSALGVERNGDCSDRPAPSQRGPGRPAGH